MEGGQVYQKVNAAWKQTCKILFGDEIGELGEYEKWLSGWMEPHSTKKSAVSGRDVYFPVRHYCKSAEFCSLDEVDFHREFEPLNINQVKDIDSIIESLRERFCYTGNIVLENSRFVDKSSNISDSFYVYNSNFIVSSKCVAYCTDVHYGENLFGVSSVGVTKFDIRACGANRATRCLEVTRTMSSSDCYYSHGLEDCVNAMFCFNLKAKRNSIGNLQLPPERYAALKEKLVGEIRETLVREKRMPSLADFILDKKPALPEMDFEDEATDKEPVEKAFGQVSGLVLAKELEGVDGYGPWLMRFVRGVSTAPSAVSKKPVYIDQRLVYKALPKDRVVKEKEGRRLGELLKIGEKEPGSLDEIRSSLWKIAFFTPELRFGETSNVIHTAFSYSSTNCYYGGLWVHSDRCGFSFWPRHCTYMFGSETTFHCKSCINAYYSVDLARCFEVDSCSNSSDLYFSHNCENVNDSMFCFNRKNLKYAIGNASIGSEKYKPLKKSILEQITDELEAKKSFRWNIYNIAERG